MDLSFVLDRLILLPSLPAQLQTLSVFLLIIIGLYFYASERLSMEVTALLLLCSLLALFVVLPPFVSTAHRLSSATLLSGFASPALLTVLGLLVIGEALANTGALAFVSRWLSRLPSYSLAMLLLLLAALLLSAFLNNIPVVVLFIPVLRTLMERRSQEARWSMMGMSFASVLGGMTTLIGSSTNLLVAGALISMERESLSFFSITLPGLCLAGVGMLYILFVLPRLLANPREGWRQRKLQSARKGKGFVAQFTITGDSPFVGKAASVRLFSMIERATVVLVQRGEVSFSPPKLSFQLRAGDVLLISASRRRIDELVEAEEYGLLAPQLSGLNAARESSTEEETILAEFFVPPHSSFVGRSLQDLRFRFRYHCVVLGLERSARRMLRNLTSTKLRAGDIALVQGRTSDVRALGQVRDLVAVEDSIHKLPDAERASIAAGIFALCILAAATGMAPIAFCAIFGATLMIALGVISLEDAVRALDRKIVLVIASAIALASALQITGGDSLLAQAFLFLTQSSAHPPLVLSCFFIFVAILSNVISTKAAAVLFTPIAVAIADRLGVSHIPFAIAVLFAANCAFATPIGYQTNLLVMNAGQYRFGDFLRAGLPLIIVCWGCFTILSYVYFFPSS